MRPTPMILCAGLAIVATSSACSSATDHATPTSSAVSTAASSASPPTDPHTSSSSPLASAPAKASAAAPAEAALLAFDDPKAARTAVRGKVVFVVEAGEAPGLYALDLNTTSPKPTKLIAADEKTRLGWPSIDPTGKSVLYTQDAVDAGTKRGEIWSVPFTGGTAHRVARCTDSCRSPFVVGDGRILYVDHGAGLTRASVRFVKPGASSAEPSAVFGGAAALETCSITLDVDLPGRRFLVNVNNELGWECAVDTSTLFTLPSLGGTKLARPAVKRGSCVTTFGDDDRLYVTGFECEPSGSFAPDGDKPTFPDPKITGGEPPETRWRLVIDHGRVVARPPRGAAGAAFVVVDAEVTSFFHRPG